MTMTRALRAPVSNPSRLEQLLNKDFLSAIVAEAAQTMNWLQDVRFACITRVHPRGGGGFVAEAEVSAAQGDRLFVFIEAPAEDIDTHAAHVLHRYEKQACRMGHTNAQVSPVYVDAGLGICVRPRGVDELIDGLAVVDVKRPGPLAGLEPPDLLAHRLNRRAVLRFARPRGGNVIAKLYKKGSGKLLEAIQITKLLERTAFGDSSPVRIPEIVAHLESWNGYVMSETPGVPLSRLSGQMRMQGMRLAGSAMGRLHRLPLRLQKNHTISDETKLLRDWVQFSGPFLPINNRITAQALNAIESVFNEIGDGPVSLIHRDFHDGQILCEGNRATLIDFDTACNGDPAQDIGNFLAHLDFAALLGVATNSDGVEAFFDGYREAFENPDATRVDAHRRATSLRLACIHAFAPHSTDACKQLVAKVLGA
jgi:hypothetical protein